MIEGVEETVDNLHCPLTNKCSHHNADQHVRQQLAEWTEIICAQPVDVKHHMIRSWWACARVDKKILWSDKLVQIILIIVKVQ